MNNINRLPTRSIPYRLRVVLSLVVGLVYLAACSLPSTAPAQPGRQTYATSPLAPVSPVATEPSFPLALVSPVATVSASPSGLDPASVALRLTVLHTNDTWGYLVPCG